MPKLRLAIKAGTRLAAAAKAATTLTRRTHSVSKAGDRVRNSTDKLKGRKSNPRSFSSKVNNAVGRPKKASDAKVRTMNKTAGAKAKRSDQKAFNSKPLKSTESSSRLNSTQRLKSTSAGKASKSQRAATSAARARTADKKSFAETARGNQVRRSRRTSNRQR